MVINYLKSLFEGWDYSGERILVGIRSKVG